MADISQIPLPEQGIDAFLNSLKESAEIRKARAQANLPFGGTIPPGPAGQVVGLQMVKTLYGENSPEYQQAQQAFALSQQATGSRIGYQDALRQSLPIRYTTPEGRQIIEQSNVNQGASPAGTPVGQPVVPGQPPYNPDVNGTNPKANYGLRQMKQDVPASVLQKDLYATNIEKTLKNINLDDLTYYNGPKRKFKLKEEQAKDALGMETSPEYKKYKESEAAFNYLPDQRRQFYGSSVQPGAVERLHSQMDPRGVFESQKTGKLRFNSGKKVLESELSTYREAAKNKKVYSGDNSAPSKELTYNIETGEFE